MHVNDGRTLVRVDDLAERIPTTEWQLHSCGPGAKGARDYLWASVTTATGRSEHRWLLIRRNRITGELAFYLCWSRRPVPLHTLVTVAGSRWSIEELFQTGKGQVGLDHYQVRGWTGWHRFITLAMLALAIVAILAILAAQQPNAGPKVIALTVAEIRRLLTAFVLAQPLPPAHTLHWSIWRRTSLARARRSHYQPQTGEMTLEYGAAEMPRADAGFYTRTRGSASTLATTAVIPSTHSVGAPTTNSSRSSHSTRSTPGAARMPTSSCSDAWSS